MVTGIVITLLVNYVLAAGPVGWLCIYGYIMPNGPLWNFLVAFYEPLTLFTSFRGQPIGDVLRWYIGLWILRW
jgi:hypothetical protein